MSQETPAEPTDKSDRTGSLRLDVLIDLEQTRSLLESFCTAMGISSALIDPDGEVLVAANWQPVCTEFHRKHPVAHAHCVESDTVLAARLREGEDFSLYTCRNGLTDAASPVMVGGQHIANVFVGQFLTAPPDRDRFRRQAKDWGMDEKAYLQALAKVPVLDPQKVQASVRFLVATAQVLGTMGLEALHREQVAAEQRRTAAALRESESRYRALFEHSPVAMWEEDHSAVKEYLDDLVAQGVSDVSEYLRRTPDAYEECRRLARVTDVNEATVRLYGAADKEDLLAYMRRQYPISEDSNIRKFWGAAAQGELAASFDEAARGLNGTTIHIHETCRVAPGHEARLDKVYFVDVDMTAQRRYERRQRQTLERLRRSVDAAVGALARTVEMRDPYTAGHQERVATLAIGIADKLGLPPRRKTSLRIAATVHDIGKISVPAEILAKPSALTDIEWRLIQEHPQTGWRILREMEFPGPVARIVRDHHERLDGSGYPQGLTGDQIGIEARILAVADVVEAMSAHRPYRPSVGVDAALAEVQENAGRLFDPDVVAACVTLVREDGFDLGQLSR